MKILLFGVNGMLGHKLYQRLERDHDVVGTIRSGFDSIGRFGIFDENRIIPNVDVTDHARVREIIDEIAPDVVINCAGIIKQLDEGKRVVPTLPVNSIFPHVLAELSDDTGFRLITMSTDCVFDGSRGMYTEDDQPDARDLYGLSKYLGEVSAKNCLTIRTSIIGRELGTQHSLVEWFLSNRGGQAKGFTKAIYSGFPTVVFADIISDIVSRHTDLKGVWHISSDPISKFDLLSLINDAFETGVEIEPDDEVVIDRSLDSARFRSLTSYEPLSWPEMIRRMAEDETGYNRS